MNCFISGHIRNPDCSRSHDIVQYVSSLTIIVSKRYNYKPIQSFFNYVISGPGKFPGQAGIAERSGWRGETWPMIGNSERFQALA